MQRASQLPRIGAIGAAMTLACTLAASVQAAPVSMWSITANTFFDNVEPVSGISVTPTELWWGTTTGFGQSGLSLAGLDGIALTDGSPASNLALLHTNNPVTGTSLTKADIVTELVLSPLDPPSGAANDITITFKLNFTETTNNLVSCPGGGTNGVGIHLNGCADVFVIDKDALNWNFVYEDFNYFISFLEATDGFNPLPDSACIAAGAASGCMGFLTPERAATLVNFNTYITSEPITIPEPGTLGLFGLALAGMVGLLRRRKMHE